MPTPRPASSLRMASRSSTTSWTPLTAFNRAGLAQRQALADHHRACRAGWRHLHHPHVPAWPYVVVEGEADLLGVKVLRGVDIAHRDGNDLELHVHEPSRYRTRP